MAPALRKFAVAIQNSGQGPLRFFDLLRAVRCTGHRGHSGGWPKGRARWGRAALARRSTITKWMYDLPGRWDQGGVRCARRIHRPTAGGDRFQGKAGVADVSFEFSVLGHAGKQAWVAATRPCRCRHRLACPREHGSVCRGPGRHGVDFNRPLCGPTLANERRRRDTESRRTPPSTPVGRLRTKGPTAPPA